jgi:hypothetical protein
MEKEERTGWFKMFLLSIIEHFLLKGKFYMIWKGKYGMV